MQSNISPSALFITQNCPNQVDRKKHILSLQKIEVPLTDRKLTIVAFDNDDEQVLLLEEDGAEFVCPTAVLHALFQNDYKEEMLEALPLDLTATMRGQDILSLSM